MQHQATCLSLQLQVGKMILLLLFHANFGDEVEYDIPPAPAELRDS